MMEVSVVIPAYNRRSLIAEAIESVLAQTLPAREIIVVDDGSTDGTADIVAARFGTAVRIERLERNLGISAARNHGWRVATGELVALLDSDDAWLPGKLAAQVPQFENANVLAAHARATIVDQAGAPMPRRNSRYERAFRAAVARGYGYSGITFPWTTMLPSATVVRRNVLEELGGYDERLRDFEDWDLAWRIAARGRIAVNRDIFVRYRRHAGNTTTNLSQLELVTRKHLADVLPGYSGPGARAVRANLFRNLAWVAGERGDRSAQRAMLRASLRSHPGRAGRPWAPVRGAAPVDLFPSVAAAAAWRLHDRHTSRVAAGDAASVATAVIPTPSPTRRRRP